MVLDSVVRAVVAAACIGNIRRGEAAGEHVRSVRWAAELCEGVDKVNVRGLQPGFLTEAMMREFAGSREGHSLCCVRAGCGARSQVRISLFAWRV